MANDRGRGDRDENSKPSFPAGRLQIEGNLVRDPKDITKGDTTTVSVTIAANYRTYKGEENAHFVNVLAFGTMADTIIAEFSKGDRVIAEGELYGHEYEVKDSDEVRHELDLRASMFGKSARFLPRDRSDRDDDRGGRSSERTSSRASRDEDGDRPSRGRGRDEDGDSSNRRTSGRRTVRDEPESSTEDSGRGRRRSRVEETGEGTDDDY